MRESEHQQVIQEYVQGTLRGAFGDEQETSGPVDIIDRIDALTEVCGWEQCGRPLDPDGPSLDFCSQECQEAWHAAQVVPLGGHADPAGGWHMDPARAVSTGTVWVNGDPIGALSEPATISWEPQSDDEFRELLADALAGLPLVQPMQGFIEYPMDVHHNQLWGEHGEFLERAVRANSMPLDDWQPLRDVRNITVEHRTGGVGLVTVETGHGERVVPWRVWEEAVPNIRVDVADVEFPGRRPMVPVSRAEWVRVAEREINAAADRLRVVERGSVAG